MPNSLRRKNSLSRYVVLFAGGASAFAFVCSALTAYNDVIFSGLHQFSLALMLLSFVGVIATVLSNRSTKEMNFRIEPTGEQTADGRKVHRVIASRFENFIHLESSGDRERSRGSIPLIRRLSGKRRERIFVAVVRNTTIDLDFLSELGQLGNLIVIDIQGCRVDADAWSEFAYFDRLKYLAVFGAMEGQSEQDLYYSFPEVKTILEPVLLVHSSPDTV
ncbi:MAG: hypothetical protein LW720_05265 [Pirellula sp.]|nr:hypothetical protein [Pirellula sp.]